MPIFLANEQPSMGIRRQQGLRHDRQPVTLASIGLRTQIHSGVEVVLAHRGNWQKLINI